MILIPNFSDFAYLPNLSNTRFRQFSIPRGDSKASDIYSFGIIIQEILYRQGPFFTGYYALTTTEKVQGKRQKANHILSQPK
jgi:hypothetical protein